jgi:short-subunit dehydrogenase
MADSVPPFAAAWITGASTGIGRALALELARHGTVVAASARNVENLKALSAEAAAAGGKVVAFPLDATNRAAVVRTAGAIANAIGPLDLVVANAGMSDRMRGTQPDSGRFRALFEVNVMGVMHVLEATVPDMVVRRRGHIAVVASVAGYRGLPSAGPYCASKAALIALCESLRFDLEPVGVAIQVVNPGFVRTPLTAKNAFTMPFLLEPDDAARRFYAGLCSTRFEVTFPKRFTWLVKVLRLLPYPLYFAAMRRMMGPAAARRR